MRFIIVLFFIGVFINVMADYNALAQDSCITSECHAKMGTAKFIHGPVAAKECVVCHIVGKNDNPPKKHDLSFSMEEGPLCLSCHEELEQSFKDKTLHLPVEEGECIICHDSHQSDNKFLLTEKLLTDLCFTCHEDNMTDQKFVHGPVAGGDCIVCHDPHASKNEFLFKLKM